MNELIRSFGVALKKGWKPLRTIVFASWDGEEYGLVGSTEWVEEYLPWLSASAVAYLNVDVGTRGPLFRTSASPLLNKLLEYGTQAVPSPNQTAHGQTVYDVWDKHISTMGSGSDFTAFQDFAGVPSLDMGFGASRNSPVYHYHSNYDSFYWMDAYGDPDWAYHVTMTKVWAAVTAYLSERPVLPLNTTDYAEGLAVYIERVNDKVKDGAPHPFPKIDNAIADLHDAAVDFDAHAAHLATRVQEGLPWWKFWKRLELYREVRRVNTKLKSFERHFLHQPGLDSRSWFKHIVFAPGLWTGYAGATFPGLIEALDRQDMEAVERWAGIIETLTREAARSLRAD
jgi:N-acetylated-alpha-linked acidic dipeptidase